MKHIGRAILIVILLYTSGYADGLVVNQGTVKDLSTNLMWTQATLPISGDATKVDWGTALSQCESLSLAGYTDWRLPNIKELQSLVDLGRTPPINKTIFTDAEEAGYWSSTTNASLTDEAWNINFSSGKIFSADKAYTRYVRAVRTVTD